MTNSERIVEFMSRPAAYPDRATEVEIIETHISWVFLSDRFAYKLKKPVKFEFVDFSTPELRHQACLEELRLNRRLAPDVYLAVLPVIETNDGSLQLGGRARDGKVFDWLVHMRRLPAEQALDRLLLEARLTPDDAQQIAQRLAEFYTALPPLSIRPDEYRQALDRHIRANQTALMQALPGDQAQVRRIHGAQLRYLNIEQWIFDNRASAGRIVDGHGDLRPEHIYLTDRPIVIDCLEFSQELRRVDIADELSFLAMECERLGHAEMGELALATYDEISSDCVPERLTAFYRSYRACVRAKVAEIQREQHRDNRRSNSANIVRQYLELADQYAGQLGPPCLLVVFGLMGSGKSTLAETLAEALSIDVVSTDGVRRSLLGTSPSPAGYGEGIYRAELRRQVYDELLRQADKVLSKRLSVIFDGAFLTRELRQRANGVAYRHGAVGLNILCECPRQTALDRIEKRAAVGGSESEARVDLFDAQAQEFEPPNADEPTVRVNTTADETQQVQGVYEELQSILFA